MRIRRRDGEKIEAFGFWTKIRCEPFYKDGWKISLFFIVQG